MAQYVYTVQCSQNSCCYSLLIPQNVSKQFLQYNPLLCLHKLLHSSSHLFSNFHLRHKFGMLDPSPPPPLVNATRSENWGGIKTDPPSHFHIYFTQIHLGVCMCVTFLTG